MASSKALWEMLEDNHDALGRMDSQGQQNAVEEWLTILEGVTRDFARKE